jgi:hypothetical protein
MRHRVLAAVAVLILTGVVRALAVPTGPAAIHTGARAFFNKPLETTCTQCHNGYTTINDPSGWVRILGVPQSYAPSAVYDLTVQLHHDWDPMPPDPLRWGFQLQAIQGSTGDSCGTWIFGANAPPDSFKIVKASGTSAYKNRRYVDQAGVQLLSEFAGSPTHYGEVGQVEWHVQWQAPPGDSGKIYFFAAGNSTNGDDACFSSGDFVFTTAESTVAGGNTAVGDGRNPLELAATAQPNPMSLRTSVHFAVPQGGLVDLSVFDLSGRHVRTLLHEFQPAGTHFATWAGRDERGEICRNGVYFVRLTGPDRRSVTSKLVLAR